MGRVEDGPVHGCLNFASLHEFLRFLTGGMPISRAQEILQHFRRRLTVNHTNTHTNLTTPRGRQPRSTRRAEEAEARADAFEREEEKLEMSLIGLDQEAVARSMAQVRKPDAPVWMRSVCGAVCDVVGLTYDRKEKESSVALMERLSQAHEATLGSLKRVRAHHITLRQLRDLLYILPTVQSTAAVMFSPVVALLVTWLRTLLRVTCLAGHWQDELPCRLGRGGVARSPTGSPSSRITSPATPSWANVTASPIPHAFAHSHRTVSSTPTPSTISTPPRMTPTMSTITPQQHIKSLHRVSSAPGRGPNKLGALGNSSNLHHHYPHHTTTATTIPMPPPAIAQHSAHHRGRPGVGFGIAMHNNNASSLGMGYEVMATNTNQVLSKHRPVAPQQHPHAVIANNTQTRRPTPPSPEKTSNVSLPAITQAVPTSTAIVAPPAASHKIVSTADDERRAGQSPSPPLNYYHNDFMPSSAHQRHDHPSSSSSYHHSSPSPPPPATIAASSSSHFPSSYPDRSPSPFARSSTPKFFRDVECYPLTQASMNFASAAPHPSIYPQGTRGASPTPSRPLSRLGFDGVDRIVGLD